MLTLPATQGGPRPFADLPCNLLRRLWAPGAGVQACGPAPLTAQGLKYPARPGAPVGWDSRSIRMQKPGGRRGKLCSRESRTPEREARSATERGVSRGPSPWTRSLGTFSGARESTPPVGAGPDKPKDLPELSGKRVGFWLHLAREKSRSPWGRNPKIQRACRNPPANGTEV